MQLHQESGMVAYQFVPTKNSKARTITAAPFVMAQLKQHKVTQAKQRLLAALPETLAPIADGVHSLIQSVFDPSVLDAMVEDGNKTKIIENKLNENFAKQQFQTLWSYINHKYAYSVEFDSAELIKKAIDHINDKMYVTRLDNHRYRLYRSDNDTMPRQARRTGEARLYIGQSCGNIFRSSTR